ncbi:hypothetical protein VCUG_01477, partial [Vavraia culicis subsp. floridensis]
MVQTVLNGVFAYQTRESEEIQAEYYVENIIMWDVLKELDENLHFVVDTKNNVCMFDYVTKDEKRNIKGKCYLVYKTGANYNFYSLIETKDDYGTFMLINKRKYQLIEVSNNQEIRVIENCESFETQFTESCQVSQSDNTLSNISIFSRNSELICNSVVYNENNLSYYHSQILRYKNYDLKWKICKDESLETIIQKYVNTFKFNNHTRINHFLMTTKNEERHYCSVLSNRSGLIVVVSMAEYYLNGDYMSVILYNKFNQGKTYVCERLLDTKLLQPCNIAMKVSTCSFSLSTESFLPKIDLNYNFVLKILSCFLNERQMLFYSSNKEKVYKTIVFFIKIIKPFNYKFFISSRLPNEFQDILNSPFPFVLGADERTNMAIVHVDLDNYEMFNFTGDVLPFEKELRKKFRIGARESMSMNYLSIFRHYFTIIHNNLDIARETLINKNLKDSHGIRNLIHKPETIKTEIKYLNDTFTESFMETRIFKDYISGRKDNLMLYYTIRSLCDEENTDNTASNSFFSRSKYILNNCVLISGRDPFIYKIFLMFCEKEPKNIIYNLLIHPQILEGIAPDILELYSSNKNYNEICWFIELLKSKHIEITPEMFNCINYSENCDKRADDMVELQDYKIYVFETCKCHEISQNVREYLQACLTTADKTITEDRDVDMDLHSNKCQYDENNLASNVAGEQYNTTYTYGNNPIRRNKRVCRCKTNFNGIIVKKKNNLVGIYEIFSPKDLFVFIKRNQPVSLLELEQNIFWNVITYFLIYDLPINFKNTSNEECELIIEENNEKRCFNLLKLPQIKFIN